MLDGHGKSITTPLIIERIEFSFLILIVQKSVIVTEHYILPTVA
jgi:hypothetical protein